MLNTKRLIAVSGFIAVLGWTAGASAEEKAVAEKLPDAKTVIEKYLTASGGREAMGKLKNRVAKGTFVLLDMQVDAEFTDYTVPPDKYTEIFLGAFGTSERGYIGGVAWEVSPATGPRLLDGFEAADMKRQGAMNGLLNWEKDFKSAEVKAKKAMDGVECYEVAMVTQDGTSVTNYFAVESGLLQQIDVTTREGKVAASKFSEYKDVDGVKLPHKIASSGGQYNVEIKLASITHNAEIPADRMKLPEAIVALKK